MSEVTMQKIVSLAKRRGFVFPGSEIYGGLANTYDLGPLGVEMLRNISGLWWKHFVHDRDDMFGLDTSILMAPKVWEASGHTSSFTDEVIECKKCHVRTRADRLGEDMKCPSCGESLKGVKPRRFNLLFETHVGVVEENQSLTYLRGEIAQGMFVNFRNVLDTMRPRLPFGIAQSGKAFRNEITLGNFIFRTLEFNLAEFEYFVYEKDWQKTFETWKAEMESWVLSLGLPKSKLRWRTHTDEERAHYSKKTEDLDFEYPTGFKEMLGLAYRSDFDLKNHMEKSGTDLRYTDPDSGEKFIPHVVEPTFGLNRVFLALLTNGYVEDGDRVVLKLRPDIAPYRVAVFPLVKNKPELVKKAQEVYKQLKTKFNVALDDRGNIGKRYLSQDEIGTPHCVTIDYQTLDDDTVTIRDRDTTEQVRAKINDLEENLK